MYILILDFLTHIFDKKFVKIVSLYDHYSKSIEVSSIHQLGY